MGEGEIALYIPGLGILIRAFKLYNLVTTVSPRQHTGGLLFPLKEEMWGFFFFSVEI